MKLIFNVQAHIGILQNSFISMVTMEGGLDMENKVKRKWKWMDGWWKNEEMNKP